ncbi:S-methyl-5-thioribose-1-phosphate isomerase [bacterium]|nr:S-methyl-5-thioribose-1-phosphate isomerase [bacterium]MCI0602428.1 S-methyl-5-thioribose-1-phosphate isomerase [bacterium]
MIKTIEWQNGKVIMVDQTLLPTEEVYREYTTAEEVARAIETMVIRGAPAIGVAAAMGIALGVQTVNADLEAAFAAICERMSKTRPTAVNLFWAIDRMKRKFEADKHMPLENLRTALAIEAQKIYLEDIEANQQMGRFGRELVPREARILTHCNAGALATAGYGTALGVIRAAVEEGKNVQVYADETRPFLQGARLTAWELHKDKIPVTLITDNMAGYFMRQKKVDLVIVGADRVAANGDVANKIGTYSVAVLAKANHIPFYVAAPISTIDMKLASGQEIPIEERSAKEVVEIHGKRTAPEGIEVRHPAFDVTPSELVTAIITERGIARAPYLDSLKNLTK